VKWGFGLREGSVTADSRSSQPGIASEPGSIAVKERGLDLDSDLDRDLKSDQSEEPLEPGDHERYSHYVLKEKIVESAVTGKSVRALCGKKWIPGRDPQKFPICPICKEIHEGLRKRDEGSSGGGSGGSGSDGGSGKF
jgi:hypothetical protein